MSNATVALVNVNSVQQSVTDDEAYHRADHRRFTRKHSRFRWDRTVPVKDWHSDDN